MRSSPRAGMLVRGLRYNASIPIPVRIRLLACRRRSLCPSRCKRAAILRARSNGRLEVHLVDPAPSASNPRRYRLQPVKHARSGHIEQLGLALHAHLTPRLIICSAARAGKFPERIGQKSFSSSARSIFSRSWAQSASSRCSANQRAAEYSVISTSSACVFHAVMRSDAHSWCAAIFVDSRRSNRFQCYPASRMSLNGFVGLRWTLLPPVTLSPGRNPLIPVS